MNDNPAWFGESKEVEQEKHNIIKDEMRIEASRLRVIRNREDAITRARRESKR